MSDPLGLINSSNGTSGIDRPLGVGGLGGPARGPQAVQPPGESFKDVLLSNINDVNKLQQEAATAIEDLATGERQDIEGVMLATQKADAAFRALVAVRNKVQQAYDEIKQMRV